MIGKAIILLLVYLTLHSASYAQEKPYRILNSFSAGELSELLSAREDLSKYHSGCSVMENMFPLPQGGAQKRPGTVYVAESKNNTKIRLIPFEYSTEQSYIIELGNQYMRFYKDNAQIMYTDISFGANPSGDFAAGATMTGATSGATAIVVAKVSTQVYTIKYELGTWTASEVINCGDKNVNCAASYPTTADSSTATEISTSFLTADLFDIQFTQSADVVYLVHPDHAPVKLLRYSHDHWDLETIVFDRPAFLDENTEDITITPVTPSDETGGQTYDSSSETVGYEDSKAFDNIVTGTNGWATTSGNVTNEWVSCQWGAGKTITSVRIQPCLQIGVSTRNPRHCKIEGSNNGADWTKVPVNAWVAFCSVYDTNEIELDQINNYTDWAEVELNNSTAYTYYRVYCYDNWGAADYLEIKEIEMMEGIDTFTASSPIFTSDHVGSYWQITHTVAPTVTEASFVDVDDVTSSVTVQKGRSYDFTVTGTWAGTVALQRSYDSGTTWKDVVSTSGGSADSGGENITYAGTEEEDDAIYRAKFLDDNGGTADIQIVAKSIDLNGVIEITTYTSTTVVTAVIKHTLGGTTATKDWAEGTWSDERGHPQTITLFEDRLVFGNTTYQPDTIWGSVTADYENMEAGANDDDAIIFTLSSRQVNAIRWLIGKDKILIGTSGAEWTLYGSGDEPLTPSNVKAEQHSSYGSENLQAILANESVLFFQRGAKKMRELAYNWESDSYVSPDMTILVPEITGDGIMDTAFQQTPNSILWCVKENGDLATFMYERKELITSWARILTDGDFESVAVIHGDPEDEVWVSVNRTIGSSTVRYIEYFSDRDFGTDIDDAFYVDSGITYDSTATTTITGLDHLEGETVAVLGDGTVQTSQTVSSNQITITEASTVQAGLPFTVQLRTMPLSWLASGMTIQGKIKRINEVVARYHNSGDFDVGRDATTKETISISGMSTDEERVTFPAGYDRPGYVFVYQSSPEPLTLLALMITFMVY